MANEATRNGRAAPERPAGSGWDQVSWTVGGAGNSPSSASGAWSACGLLASLASSTPGAS